MRTVGTRRYFSSFNRKYFRGKNFNFQLESLQSKNIDDLTTKRLDAWIFENWANQKRCKGLGFITSLSRGIPVK